jgi:hypothetical protein
MPGAARILGVDHTLRKVKSLRLEAAAAIKVVSYLLAARFERRIIMMERLILVRV